MQQTIFVRPPGADLPDSVYRWVCWESAALIGAGRQSPRIQSSASNPFHKDQPAESRAITEKSSAPPTEDRDAVKVPQHREGRAKRQDESVVRNGSVSLSVRVPSEIPDALIRASADRKVKRQRPFTQQDIAVEALTVWLAKNGYLRE